mgnify:CR=1 FL=1
MVDVETTGSRAAGGDRVTEVAVVFKKAPHQIFSASSTQELNNNAVVFRIQPDEGIHLRFAQVARGGLRWSDRLEDFRTEVLGLVKAQMVKNTVIVPSGAKGDFVMKRGPEPSDRDAWLAEGVACYRMFIGALLDVTDNLVDVLGQEIDRERRPTGVRAPFPLSGIPWETMAFPVVSEALRRYVVDAKNDFLKYFVFPALGANVVILGCTELPIAARGCHAPGLTWVDSNRCLAQEVVSHALARGWSRSRPGPLRP